MTFLLPAKLKFFKAVSGKLGTFLRGFQTNKHGSFIADTLGDLIHDFFGRNIFKDILKKKPNLYNLVQIDLLDKNIRKILEIVDIGFVAKHSLEQIKSSLNSAKIMEFKKQAGEFLVKLPLKYVVERSAVFLNPILMGNPAKNSSCESHMDILLKKFVSLGRISAQSAELVKKQYQKCFIMIDQK